MSKSSTGKTKLQSFLEFTLDNFLDITTIFIAGYVVVRHQIQPFDILQLTNAVIGVLGLIAVSGIWQRNRQLNRIEKSSEETRNFLLQQIDRKVYAKDFFIQKDTLTDEIFASATTIYLLGYSLSRTIRKYEKVLKQRLAARANIRIIILDPTDDKLLQIVVRESPPATIEDWRGTLQFMEKFINEIAQTPNNNGSIEIGYLPFPPAYGLIMINPNESQGFCLVDIYHHKSQVANATFRLNSSDDEDWHNFFRQQYETLWKSCRVMKFTKSKQQNIKNAR
jgi:hypothetical protein